MVCLDCLENKYFPRDLIFYFGWFCTEEPSGIRLDQNDWDFLRKK